MTSSPYRKDDPSSIQRMFSSIAERYDAGNAALSFGLYRLWNSRLIRRVLLTPKLPEHMLDLCCGTGEITFSYLKALQKRQSKPGEISLIDFSPGMIEEAQRKSKRLNTANASLQFYVGDAQAIPLEDHSIDAVVIAYGIRNVADPARCLDEVYRVLRPGGRLGILELTRPANPLLRLSHNAYLRAAVPLLGRMVTSNAEAYRYLCNSVQGFVAPDVLSHTVRMAGFRHIEIQPLMGGVATLFYGEKLSDDERL